MRLVIITDIDDTLMQSERKTPNPHLAHVGSTCIEGKPTSFMTAKQKRLNDLLLGNAEVVIPVTARSAEKLDRVAIPFKHERIVDFGGTVLRDDGSVDQEWLAMLLALEAGGNAPRVLEQLVSETRGHMELRNVHVCKPHGLYCYASFRFVKGSSGDFLYKRLNQVLQQLSELDNFYFHRTEAEVAIIPRYVSKGSATQYVLSRYGYAKDLTVGMGDALTDIGFMNLSDYLLMPRRSQLVDFTSQSLQKQGIPC